MNPRLNSGFSIHLIGKLFMVVLFMLPDIMVFRGYLPDINTPPSQSIPAGRWTSSHPVQQEQNPDSNQTDNPRFDHITIQDGLSTSTIRSIIQDQNGFLWIGTSAGFNKYDGYEISVHGTNPDEPATLNREVTSLYADSQGNLWIGTQSGLDRLNLASGEITQFRYVPNEIQTLTADQVNTFLEDSTGAIWVGTNAGLSRFDPQSETFTRFLPHNIISDLHEDQNGLIWIASNLGLISWHPAHERFTIYRADPEDAHSISSSVVTSIQEDREGNFWVGTGYGLNFFDPDTGEFTHYLHDPNVSTSINDNFVMSLLQDSQGRTWIGTFRGINLYDPDQDGFHHFQNDPAVPSSLSDDFITALFEDQSGVIWIGTLSGGLNKLSDDNNRFQSFPSLGAQSPIQSDPLQISIRESLHSTVITDIRQDSDGDLWIATILNGLYRFNHETGIIKQFNYLPNDPNSLSSDVVQTIFEDRSGELWIGTENGLNQVDRQSETFERFPTFIGVSVYEIAQDKAGDLWVGSAGGLFRLFSDPAGDLLSEKRAFSSNDPNIYTLLITSDGSFWVATNEGVFVQFPGEQAFTHFTTDPENPDSISGKEVFSLYEDPQGVVWLGTIDGGLNRFDRSTRTFKSYSTQEGLPGNWIACIQADDQGNLWLGTNRGLSKFNPQMGTFINYDNQDGLQAGEFYSCTKTANGELYFGGLQGINAFYPQDITNNLDLPPVVITSFNLFNQTEMEDLEDGEKLELNHQENFISFDYVALDFNAPQKNQYAYMLEGLDQDWVYVGSRRHAEYPDLNPGEYTFRVKASNNDGIWNEDGTSVHISIKPPVWQTAWFQVLMVVLLAGAVFAGYQLRVRNLRARSRELEAEVEQRTNALNERTQEAEERQAEIEALYRADEELYRYLHLDHVLNALMETAIDILKADKGLLVVWDENHESLEINASTGFQPETIDSLEFTPGEGNIGTVALHGEPIIVADAAADPKISQELVKAEQIHTSILVPIKINTEIFGVFSVDYVQPHPVSDQELRLLAALAQRTALAIENARLYEQAQALAAMEERNRLARDLHDSVTQSLFGASMFADTAEKQLSAGQIDQASETISKLRGTTKGALGEMRLLIYELRPPVLENEGLSAALVSRLETVEQRAGLRTELDIEDIDRLSPDIEQQFYSIAIEALNNILKHAKAEKISVSLNQEGTRIKLQVEDDGIGFDLAAARESGGLGLIGMEERAAQLGAQLNIESAPGNGTCLQLIMEIEQ